MDTVYGRVLEVRLAAHGERQALLGCPARAIPAPGQYLQAHALRDEEAPLAASVFLGGPLEKAGEHSTYLSAAPIPDSWQPGDEVQLRGPYGHGFVLPPEAKRLALVALSENLTRLLPLVHLPAYEIALFCDAPLPHLPSQVEANPLGDLAQAWRWADLALFDGPAAAYDGLPGRLGAAAEGGLPCPAQALVYTDMPCAGIAECGVCAVRGEGRKRWLACEDGPVFALDGRGLARL